FRRCSEPPAAWEEWPPLEHRGAFQASGDATGFSRSVHASRRSKSRTNRRAEAQCLPHPAFLWSPERQTNLGQKENRDRHHRIQLPAGTREKGGASKECLSARFLRWPYRGTASDDSAAQYISCEWLRAPGREPRVPDPRCPWRCD